MRCSAPEGSALAEHRIRSDGAARVEADGGANCTPPLEPQLPPRRRDYRGEMGGKADYGGCPRARALRECSGRRASTKHRDARTDVRRRRKGGGMLSPLRLIGRRVGLGEQGLERLRLAGV